MSDHPITTQNRGCNYRGLLQILSYNRRLYFLAGVVILIISLVLFSSQGSPVIRTLLTIGLSFGVYFFVISLLVSHWVYDRSGIYQLEWLDAGLKKSPAYWVNIHAGLDETSDGLTRRYPDSTSHVFDIFDSSEMTEPSIKLARDQVGTGVPSIPADFNNLPLADSSQDGVFIICAAHEIRRRRSREQFFKELRRVLKANGSVILVEHLRDTWNFLAFGPGAFHFFGRREWLDLAEEGGLSLRHEWKLTPFVRGFLFRPTST